MNAMKKVLAFPLKRRRILKLLAGATLGTGTAMASVPFIASLKPSKYASSRTYIDVDVSKLEEGQAITVFYTNKPVVIVKRTATDLAALTPLNKYLADPFSIESKQPEAVQTLHRSLRPDIFVAVNMCTHLGCDLIHNPDHVEEMIADLQPAGYWQGGFFCPCHGAIYDLAGRVYNNMPAPENMVIPPHRYLRNGVLRIGGE